MTDGLRTEDGFTLVELLVATLIGTIVLMASFTIVDFAVHGQVQTENRLDALSRGRQAMEQVSRQVRSQMCLGRGRPPIVEAHDNRIVFYASLAPAPATGTTPPIQLRTVEFIPDPAQGASRGFIQETVVEGDGTPPPDTRFVATPRVRRLAENVSPVPGRPLFSYFKYDAATAPGVVLLTPALTGLSEVDRRMVVQVRTTFDAWAVGGKAADRVRTRLDNTVLVRTADPSDPTRSPQCI